MRHQIRTMQVPQNWGTGAFTVIPARNSTASFNGQNIVTGAPGTVPVYSPRPAALNDSSLGGPYNQPSACAPDYILPSIYVAHVNSTMHFPGALLGHNPSPVPAATVGMIPQQWQHKARIGGRTVTSAVRPFTQWPTYGNNGNA